MEEFKVPATTPKTVIIPKPHVELQIAIQNDTIQETQADGDVPKRIILEDTICPYEEPKWSRAPLNSEVSYKFEVLKSGSIVEEVQDLQNQPYWVFGRLASNDIVMAHPSISRHHAVLQYRSNTIGSNDHPDIKNTTAKEKSFSEGWYIYDMGSTHGTFLNKMRIPPKTYIPVRVGHILTLGGSTRKYILQGPDFDEEPESELSITELKEQRIRLEEERLKQAEMQEAMREKEGISWGMGEDADEETDLTINPYASTNNEDLFLDDPKKTLRGFFERDGLELEYKVDEMSPGTFVCRVELPIDDAIGKPIVAEVCHKGRKKECVLQCALEACRILDRQGVLRQAHHEPMKRRAPAADSDDDDDFLDRTGDVERKKLRKANLIQNNALTYADLLNQEKQLLDKVSVIKDKILRYQESLKRSKESASSQNDGDLDDFMKHLSNEKEMDKTEIRKLRVEEQQLQVEHQKLQRLIKIATPAQLPSIKNPNEDNIKKKSFFPLFGKRNKTKVQLPQQTSIKKPKSKEINSDEEEMEVNEVVALSAEDCSEVPSQIHIDSIPDQPNTSINPIKGPAFISPEIRALNLSSTAQSPIKSSETEPTKQQVSHTPSPPQSSSEIEIKFPDPLDSFVEKTENDQTSITIVDGNDSAAAKKRRNRNRNRMKGRENVDIDDKEELEDGEKYSGWIPPENQAGDGITSLNYKFGY